MHFLVRAQTSWQGDVLALAPTLRKEIGMAAPEVGVFNFVAFETEVGNSLWQQRLRGWLFGFFSIVALSLVGAGLSGAVAYGVAQRRREIGIRMALGATPGTVQRLVLGQGLRSVAIGLTFGIAGALGLSRILTATLFGISGNDLVSYGAACLLLGITAVIAALIPARRACLVSPMEALRTE
jgi:ABC-type antimicrobial peptide transport system permease subunit